MSLAQLLAVKLTYQQGQGQKPRWKRIHRGKALYYPAVSREDEKSAALAKWGFIVDRQAIDRGQAPPCQGRGALHERFRQAIAAGKLDKEVARILANPTLLNAIMAKVNDRKGETVAEAVASYLAYKRGQTQAGELAAGSYQRLAQQLPHLVKWGGDKPVELSGADWLDFKGYLLDLVSTEKLSLSSAKSYLVACKGFGQWAYETERVKALPRNWKKIRINARAPEPKPYTADEARQILTAGTSRRNKLYLHLMLNCGMQGRDIASLRRDNVDFDKGTLTYKRAKTRKHGNAPTVTYGLWSTTLELLREFGEEQGLLLLSETGKPLWTKTVKDGKATGKDLVGQALKRHLQIVALREVVEGFKRRTGETATAVNLRSTGASLIRNSEFADLDGVYLGHAPASVRDKHYSAIPAERFLACCEYLGGIVFAG